MTAEKDVIRRDRAALESALHDAGAVFKGKAIRCPFHDDRNPSASLYTGEDGAWRFKCHGCGFCGDVFDVRARVAGKQPEDLLRELKSSEDQEPRRKVRIFSTIEELEASLASWHTLEACYRYTDPDTGRVDMIVLRCLDSEGKKTFLQYRPYGEGYAIGAPPKPWPIYNRTRVKLAHTVIVVEGEKCVHALTRILPDGYAATTSPGGAGKAALADWKPLAGKSLVVLWPDNDPADPQSGKSKGGEHMRDVGMELDRLEAQPSVSMLDPDILSIPPKGDVVEFLELFGGDTPESQWRAIKSVLPLADPLGASADLKRLLEDTISGKRRAIAWEWGAIGRLTKALMPGTVTAIGGDPGCGKSFLLLEAMAYWHGKGEKVALYELEEDRAYHLNRLLAQLCDNASLTDPDWVHANPDAVRSSYESKREFLDGFGRNVFEAPDEQASLDQLTAWVKDRCAAGCRIIGIDPITAAVASSKPWVDDLKFLMAVKVIVREYGASLVLATHPRKGKKVGGGLDDLAGGAAYQRFPQTVLWLERLEQKETFRVKVPNAYDSREANRILKLRKTRNGKGAGLHIAFYFDPKSLRFAEQGVIVGNASEDVVL